MQEYDPNNDLKTPVQKRKRLAQACIVCRKKKTKCDGVQPECGNCVRLKQECSYIASAKKRIQRQGHIDMLEQRLLKMEAMLAQSIGHDHNQLSPVSETPSDTPGELLTESPASRLEANMDSLYEVPSNPVDTSSPPIESTKNSNIQTACHTQPTFQRNNQWNSNILPSDDEIMHLTQLYLAYLHELVPILNRDILLEAIEKKTVSEFFVLSLCAVAARFSDRPSIRTDPIWQSGDKYAEKARAILNDVLENPRLEYIQGLLLLTLHYYGCAQGPRSWMYTGMAIRMCLDLELHIEPALEHSIGDVISMDKWTEYETRRKVFWDTFSHDKFASAATGRPSSIPQEDCNTFMPTEDTCLVAEKFYAESIDGRRCMRLSVQRDSSAFPVSVTVCEIFTPNEMPSNREYRQRNWCSQMLREIALMGKITEFVNRGIRRKSPIVCFDPESPFAKLDSQLEEWSIRLPHHMRNTPANFERFRTRPGLSSALFFFAHMLHNAMVVLLHRPALMLSETMALDILQPEMRELIQNSIEKCKSASDNVTLILREINTRIELIPPFLTYLAYTMTTVIINDCFSEKPDESQKAKTALCEHFRLLQTMRPYWAMAHKLYFMIQDLYSSQKQSSKHHSKGKGKGKEKSNMFYSSVNGAEIRWDDAFMKLADPSQPTVLLPSQINPPSVPSFGVSSASQFHMQNAYENSSFLYQAAPFVTPFSTTLNPLWSMSLDGVVLPTTDWTTCIDNDENQFLAAIHAITGANTPSYQMFPLQHVEDNRQNLDNTQTDERWPYRYTDPSGRQP
ncbi:Zn(2)-C6 fungal-specific transcription factor [Phycomyces blakesleeanus]|uniref:Zn(2)-C6 fungal-specific transcription factor n=1 Tax=Phycomyces blakesleeanus TaxID=4837 RepID=A0ABR3B533_PHYBL